MYNTITKQCEVLKWNKARVLKFEIDGRTGFTNGFIAYVFGSGDLLIDKDKYQNIDEKRQKSLFETTDNHYELDVSFIFKFDTRKRMEYMRLEAPPFNVYVQRKFIKDFHDCKFYATDALSPVLIKRMGVLVAVVMPVRLSDGEKF